MKAQGLSVSFVVVAALAILVLVLGVAFLMGAFSSQKTSASIEQAKSACNTLCSNLQAAMSGKDCTTTTNGTCTANECVCDKATDAYKKYCNAKFNIAGTSYNCTQLVQCTVNDVYGNPIPVDCTGLDDGDCGSCTS